MNRLLQFASSVSASLCAITLALAMGVACVNSTAMADEFLTANCGDATCDGCPAATSTCLTGATCPSCACQGTVCYPT
ncbi:hypothetical protein SAMN05444166_4983 [Singulisphaera sp. GP187]|uniref:hypothetical protein n=1 Tax=Singulisphaera sp. GP187 TaxID=1882752 RepID=UPI000928F4FF|nr:hypothetical protein [Singulisphaera sp. GP187]SIO46718.1 hypothetical protein SAMN05444166_4983 [Singulisphaera sp. GP187]